MSAAFNITIHSQPAEPGQTHTPPTPANDNCHLHLVANSPPGVLPNHSRSAKLILDENQMIRAQNAGLDMEYWYDAEGRRSHSLDHVANTETFHKHFGQMEVGDYAVTREGGQIGVGKALTYTETFRIVLGAGIDERIAYHDVNGDDLSFYLTNHQGSTIAMVSENGTRLPNGSGGRYVYDPYGNEMSGASNSGQPYRYTGRRLDAQTGLHYYRARYYSTELGRFLQTDPIGYEDQMALSD